MLMALLFFGSPLFAKSEREVIDPNVAIRKAVVTLQEDQLNAYIERMQAFAHECGFAIRIAPTAPTGKDFVLEFWREDVKILAANPFEKGSFRVSVFNISGKSINEGYVDQILLVLKRYSLEVKGATFVDQPGNDKR